jgi:hypothetical protein
MTELQTNQVVGCDAKTCNWARSGLSCPDCLAEKRRTQRASLDRALTEANDKIRRLRKEIEALKRESLDGSCDALARKDRRCWNCHIPFEFLTNADGEIDIQVRWWDGYIELSAKEAELRQAEALIGRGSVVTVSVEHDALCAEEKLLQTRRGQLQSFMQHLATIVTAPDLSDRFTKDKRRIRKLAVRQLRLIYRRLVQLDRLIASVVAPPVTVTQTEASGNGAAAAHGNGAHDARNRLPLPAPS